MKNDIEKKETDLYQIPSIMEWIKVGNRIKNKNDNYGEPIYKITGIGVNQYGADVVFTDATDYYKEIHLDTLKEYFEPCMLSDEEYDNIEASFKELISQENKLDETSEETALMKVDKSFYQDLYQQQAILRNKTSAIYSEMKYRYDMELRKAKDMLDALTENINKIASLIYKIELYLGVFEEIHHIKVGMPTDSILCIRQNLRYMDELVSDPENDGLDFQKIENFDEWLLQYSAYHQCYNYEFVVPDAKCITLVRVRRQDKRYGNDVLYNWLLNKENHKVYILIRNGENLYRIWIDRNPEGFFPSKEALEIILKNKNESRWDSEKKQAERVIDSYKTNFLILQGLIDRSSILQPLELPLNLFSPAGIDESKVRLVYEDESTMLSNNHRPNFKEWKDQINATICEGTRIYFQEVKNPFSDYLKDRFKRYRQWQPNLPSSGIYTVIDDKEWIDYYTKESTLKIMYVPHYYWKDEDEKTNKVSFGIHFDDKLLNIEEVTFEDIDYYIHSWENRKFYLDSMNLLKKVWEYKKKELELEIEFAKMVARSLDIDYEINKDVIHGTIIWWKTKNKWKRGLYIDKQDEKALRMISRKLKSTLKI